MPIISDDLTHDTTALNDYQKIIVDYLKTNYNPQEIYYFTDAAG